MARKRALTKTDILLRNDAHLMVRVLDFQRELGKLIFEHGWLQKDKMRRVLGSAEDVCNMHPKLLETIFAYMCGWRDMQLTAKRGEWSLGGRNLQSELLRSSEPDADEVARAPWSTIPQFASNLNLPRKMRLLYNRIQGDVTNGTEFARCVFLAATILVNHDHIALVTIMNPPPRVLLVAMILHYADYWERLPPVVVEFPQLQNVRAKAPPKSIALV